jgi:hypothetical protein
MPPAPVAGICGIVRDDGEGLLSPVVDESIGVGSPDT